MLCLQLPKHHTGVGVPQREAGDEPRPEPEQVIDRAGTGNALDAYIGLFGELRCNHPGDVRHVDVELVIMHPHAGSLLAVSTRRRWMARRPEVLPRH